MLFGVVLSMELLFNLLIQLINFKILFITYLNTKLEWLILHGVFDLVVVIN